MAGTLSVQKIQGLATSATPTVVEISSGHTLHQAGAVLQVVSAEETAATSSTSGSAVNIVSVNITPKFSSSKIYITASVHCSTASSGRAGVGLYKGSNPVVQGDASGSRTRAYGQVQNSDTGIFSSVTMTYLDSPATTSETTYSAKMVPEDGSTTFYINRSASDNDSGSRFRGVSAITVMEIAQ